MIEASYALQQAIFTALSASTDLQALGAAIFDRVPPEAACPYVVIGRDQVVDGDHDCVADSVEIFSQIDVWSRAVGKVEAKKLIGAVKRALHNADLPERDGFAFQSLLFSGSAVIADPDGITTHGIANFRALVETAA